MKSRGREWAEVPSALPSGKFGANAAWSRLNVLTYNLLTALQRLTLPGDFATARPKWLRFLLFNTRREGRAPRPAHPLTPTGAVHLALNEPGPNYAASATGWRRCASPVGAPAPRPGA